MLAHIIVQPGSITSMRDFFFDHSTYADYVAAMHQYRRALRRGEGDQPVERAHRHALREPVVLRKPGCDHAGVQAVAGDAIRLDPPCERR